MVGGIVIESPTGDRAVVAPEALSTWLLRGFVAVGPVAPPGAEGVNLTAAEWDSELARRAAVIAAALNPPAVPTKNRSK